MKINFKCKICNSIQEIEEVLENVTQYSIISNIEKLDDKMVAIDYGNSNTEFGDLSHFQCMNCGTTLKSKEIGTINTPEELYEWLEENNMLKEN